MLRFLINAGRGSKPGPADIEKKAVGVSSMRGNIFRRAERVSSKNIACLRGKTDSFYTVPGRGACRANPSFFQLNSLKARLSFFFLEKNDTFFLV